MLMSKEAAVIYLDKVLPTQTAIFAALTLLSIAFGGQMEVAACAIMTFICANAFAWHAWTR